MLTGQNEGEQGYINEKGAHRLVMTSLMIVVASSDLNATKAQH